jgi:hypothetical protein
MLISIGIFPPCYAMYSAARVTEVRDVKRHIQCGERRSASSRVGCQERKAKPLHQGKGASRPKMTKTRPRIGKEMHHVFSYGIELPLALWSVDFITNTCQSRKQVHTSADRLPAAERRSHY